MPKKTGIDKITQIEDYDLFDYDREVQPILNVLLSKTVEQALLEVEEETELDEIRRFKNGAYKRQSEDREGWEQEVKREIARIKAKNKALKVARAKREQQARTLQKIQCLAVAKQYLKSTFLGSMEALNAQQLWRSKFEDQLNITYKDWLLRKVQDEFLKGAKVEEFIGGHAGIIGSQVHALEETKEPIRKSIAATIAKKHRVREIESDHKRTV